MALTWKDMITLEGRRGQAADEDAWAAAGLSKSGLTRFVREAQRAVGLANAVDVLLANDRTLRRAMVYGSVLGSFTVEKFGLDRLRTLKRSEIHARARHFAKLTQFKL